MNESTDLKDTAQLLIFIGGITDNFQIREEYLTMDSLKRKTRGEDLYDSVSGVIERLTTLFTLKLNVSEEENF